ncbi:hypothetical protein D3C86_2039050 [compost metagenome]
MYLFSFKSLKVPIVLISSPPTKAAFEKPSPARLNFSIQAMFSETFALEIAPNASPTAAEFE